MSGSYWSSENGQKGDGLVAVTYTEEVISKDMKLEHIELALQKVAEGIEAVYGPTFSDAEIN